MFIERFHPRYSPECGKFYKAAISTCGQLKMYLLLAVNGQLIVAHCILYFKKSKQNKDHFDSVYQLNFRYDLIFLPDLFLNYIIKW